MRPLIIERPGLQSRLQHWGYRWVTLIGWVLWLYLFMPLLSLVAWVLGATLVYQTLLQGLEVTELGALLRRYGSGIAVLCSVLLIWAFTSYLRFRDVDRRRAAPPASAEALRKGHRLGVREYATLQAARRLVVSSEQLERMFASRSAGEDDEEPVGEDAKAA